MERADAAQPGPGPFDLHTDSFGRLVLTLGNGPEHTGVVPIRAFPISDPRHGVALCDAEGHELLWIDDLDALPSSLRQYLEDALTRREFLPTVRRIVKESSAVLPAEWEVETDHGPTRFILSSEDNIQRLDDYRALLTDAHGIRYLIADTRDLDIASRRVLERYL